MFKVKTLVGLDEVGEDSSLPFSLIALGTTNPTLVKDSPGVLLALHVINVSAAVRYLKFYDTKIAPVAGKGIPVRRYAIPGSATGAGFVIAFPVPARFSIGIGFTLTTGQADSDATALTAGDVVLTGEYA